MSSIELNHLRYRYAATAAWAISDATLRVDPGEIVLLEGESGSGKSTLLRLLAGLAPAFHGGEAAGYGMVAGVELRTAEPAQLAQRVGFLFQDAETQGVMAEPLRDVAFSLQCHGRAAAGILPAARAALSVVRAEHLIGRRLDQLSAGERQRVALAAVLAPEPAVLLLDEPTAQLDDDTACELVGELRRLADRGLTILIAEHRHDRVGHLTDRVLGLQGGRLVPGAGASPLETLASPELVDGPALLELVGLAVGRRAHPVLREVTASLRRGRVVALIGANGSGKSTLLRTLAGLDPALAGSVQVCGQDVTRLAAEERVPQLAFVPQDPGRALLCNTIRAEVTLGPRTLGLSERAAEAALVALELSALAARNPRECSVGERERVAIAAAMALSPTVLLLDEPTRGMDLRHRARLVVALRRQADQGGVAVVATHDLSLARACADERWLVADGHVHCDRSAGEAPA